jgi:adenine deaminase
MKKILVTLLAFFTVGSMMAQTGGNVLVKGGTVLTVTKGTLEATDVLVTNGKIVQVGRNLSAPSGHTVIDANGMFVMPGIIDAHSHVAIDAVNEGTRSEFIVRLPVVLPRSIRCTALLTRSVANVKP